MKKFILLMFGFLLATMSIKASPQKTSNSGYYIEQLTDFEQINIASININAVVISNYDVTVSSETIYNSINVSDNPIFCYTDNLRFADKRLIYDDIYNLNQTSTFSTSFDLNKSRMILQNGNSFNSNKQTNIRHYYKNFDTQINSFSFNSSTNNIGYNKYIFFELKPVENNLKRTKNKFLS